MKFTLIHSQIINSDFLAVSNWQFLLKISSNFAKNQYFCHNGGFSSFHQFFVISKILWSLSVRLDEQRTLVPQPCQMYLQQIAQHQLTNQHQTFVALLAARPTFEPRATEVPVTNLHICAISLSETDVICPGRVPLQAVHEQCQIEEQLH